MPKKKKPFKLTGKQARYLRGLGHHLQPMVMIGREEITDTLIAAADAALAARELIKVKMLNTCPLKRDTAAASLAENTGSAVGQILGRTFLLYRENKDLPPEKKIQLP